MPAQVIIFHHAEELAWAQVNAVEGTGHEATSQKPRPSLTL